MMEIGSLRISSYGVHTVPDWMPDMSNKNVDYSSKKLIRLSNMEDFYLKFKPKVTPTLKVFFILQTGWIQQKHAVLFDAHLIS